MCKYFQGVEEKMLPAFLSPSLFLIFLPCLFVVVFCFTPFLSLALNSVRFFSSPNSSFLLSAKGVSGPAAGTEDPTGGLGSYVWQCFLLPQICRMNRVLPVSPARSCPLHPEHLFRGEGWGWENTVYFQPGVTLSSAGHRPPQSPWLFWNINGNSTCYF